MFEENERRIINYCKDGKNRVMKIKKTDSDNVNKNVNEVDRRITKNGGVKR